MAAIVSNITMDKVFAKYLPEEGAKMLFKLALAMDTPIC